MLLPNSSKNKIHSDCFVHCAFLILINLNIYGLQRFFKISHFDKFIKDYMDKCLFFIFFSFLIMRNYKLYSLIFLYKVAMLILSASAAIAFPVTLSPYTLNACFISFSSIS